MHESLNFLLEEYCESLARTRRMKTKAAKRGKEGKIDVSLLSGMESSLSWAIEYMVTGYLPVYESGGTYRMVIPSDPQTVMTRFSNEIVRKRSNDEKMDQVLCVLDKLSDKERDCILLVWGEGFSYREAGKIMKLPTMTVWDNCKRAMSKLKGVKAEQYKVKE